MPITVTPHRFRVRLAIRRRSLGAARRRGGDEGGPEDSRRSLLRLGETALQPIAGSETMMTMIAYSRDRSRIQSAGTRRSFGSILGLALDEVPRRYRIASTSNEKAETVGDGWDSRDDS